MLFLLIINLLSVKVFCLDYTIGLNMQKLVHFLMVFTNFNSFSQLCRIKLLFFFFDCAYVANLYESHDIAATWGLHMTANEYDIRE